RHGGRAALPRVPERREARPPVPAALRRQGRALAPAPEPGLRAALPPGRGRRHTGLPAHRMASLRRAPAGRRPDGRRAVPRAGGRTAGGGDRGRLHDLCASYTTFHEVTALLPGEGRKRLREVVTGIEWTARDVEDSE